MIHFLIVQLDGQDLLDLAIASIDRYAGHCNVDVVKLPDNTTDPRAHGAAVDHWRRFQQVAVLDRDVVVLMDPDAVLLSEQWRVELDKAFADPAVGIWGAGAVEDWGPRVHAHMMAIRGSVFNTLERSFTPCLDIREKTWRDTGGLYCMWVQAAEMEVRKVERGPDWNGFSAWWGMEKMGETVLNEWYTPVPLWSHLGSGSHSDPQRLNWRQRYLSPWRRREIAKRKRFIAAVTTHLTA